MLDKGEGDEKRGEEVLGRMEVEGKGCWAGPGVAATRGRELHMKLLSSERSTGAADSGSFGGRRAPVESLTAVFQPLLVLRTCALFLL